MSKIGKKPIIIPEGAAAKIEGNALVINDKGGVLNVKILPGIKAIIENGVISFTAENDLKQTKANWGTMRALTNNAVLGVNAGFEKFLKIEGVGYRAVMEGNVLVLSVGLSHPVKFESPQGIKISVEKSIIKVSGINRELVGQTAAKIRAVKKPEPYKGKGIKYENEVIIRKAGKKATAAAK